MVIALVIQLFSCSKLFVTDSTQQVLLVDMRSTLLPTNAGKSEGSLPSPIVFHIYSKRLPKLVPEHCAIAYADDATLVFSHKNLSCLSMDMQSLFNLVSQWAENARLLMNKKKFFSISVVYLHTTLISLGPLVSLDGVAFLGSGNTKIFS